MTRCTSRFYGTQCDRPRGHVGDHNTWDSSSHITTWNHLAADDQGLDQVHDHVGGAE